MESDKTSNEQVQLEISDTRETETVVSPYEIKLAQEYREASLEWESSPDAAIWESAIGDGL